MLPPSSRSSLRAAVACMSLLAALAGCASSTGPQPPLLKRVEDDRPAPIAVAVPRPVRAESATSPSSVEDRARDLASVIYFGPDRYTVDDTYLPLLQSHARKLLSDPSLQLRIDAFTDDQGPADYNLELSRMRALSVQRQLKALGVPPTRMQIVGHGPARKAVGGSGTRTSSRRVELTYR